ncbi:putative mitochondrial protein [Sesamum angolense]|uniref:Mitochondrial protein n=1 Tax=Sesamum angolense TaxID=2727404 RepID=A0AAE1WE58_9LAMI|nr:putative mitochondrial protein [Sesamum angolense]
MEADLSRLEESLVLTEEEDLGVVMPMGIWHSDPKNGGFHVVGCVLSHKPYHVAALKTVLKSFLNLAKGMDISFIEGDRFLLKFFHSVDRDRVLASDPWAFEKNLVVLAPVSDIDNPAEVDLAWCDFHVRIHGLPLGKMTPEIASFIGGKIGCLKDFDLSKGPESWGSFMRLRFAINVTKPLSRALKLRTVLGDEHIVTFTYERLPNFCYLCERIGHISKWCETRFQANFVDPGDNSPFGPWLRSLTRVDLKTRFSQHSQPHSNPQAFRHRFSPRQSGPTSLYTETRRGTAIFGDFPPITESPGNLPFPHSLQSCSSNFSSIPRFPSPPTDKVLSAPSLFPSVPTPPSSSTLSSNSVVPSPAPTAPLSQSFLRPASPLPKPVQSTPSQSQITMIPPKRKYTKKAYPPTESHLCPQPTIPNKRCPIAPPGAMSLLVWNCQGLGNPWTVKGLRDLIQENNPHLVFLAETKCSSRQIETLKRRLNLFGCCVESRDRSGGLALLWHKSVEGFTGSRIHRKESIFERSFVGYTFSHLGLGYALGTSTKSLPILRKKEVLRERNGRFATFAIVYQTATCMTWVFGALVLLEACVRHDGSPHSDHSPLIVELRPVVQWTLSESRRCFRFEAAWLQEPTCEGIISKAWLPPGFSLSEKIASVSAKLYGWDRALGRETRDRIQELERSVLTKKHGVVTAETQSRGVFTSCNPLPDDIRSGTKHLPTVVDEAMAEDLQRPYTESEGSKHFMNIKLDISKAYDRVEWSFLRRVLGKLGFPCVVVDLIMLCVTTVSYSFVLSGHQFGSIIPQRGFRQGDPLSPYLFLLCTESLSALFRVAAEWGTIPGMAVCQGAPRISHLLFADDTMVFCPANVSIIQHVRQVLDQYKLASGQEINLHKSSVAFSPVAFRSKRALFAALKDRIWKRIQGWHEKLLSQAGKAVLIQAVVQAIPSYAMSCFRLPKMLLVEFQSLAANLFWHDGDKRRIHWLAWDHLCRSKLDRGLGFCNLAAFNLALLAKQL